VKGLHDVEHGTGILSFRSRRDGVDRDVKIDWNLLTSAEYRQLAGNAYGIEAIAAKHFAVRKVEEPGSKKEAADATEHETLDEEDAYAAAGVPRTSTPSPDSYAAAARSRTDG